ncbi:hypothetical protein HPP92_019243 [Vanilla planifolia]|uniref:Cyclin-dependent protein kinase inhibitor SMR4 n=1 Tax=Vanilla planifolia TaxID=51239 RepID=A0A835UN62_VANPL|nr:hypothetical protein HPP92_019243 [Vanilla planifolia]
MGAERGEEGWETPKRGDCRIPSELPCPPPPRKRSPVVAMRRDPPKGGYFRPPDLEALFVVAPRSEACA